MRILLAVYDNDSYIHYFPQGIAYVAGALIAAGHEVEIWSQDIHHYPDADLTARLDGGDYDLIGIGLIAGYYQYRRILSLAKAVNRAKKRPFFVLGGHGPTPDPAYFMKITGADAVVMGEGELTIVDLTRALAAGRSEFADIPGLAWRKNDECRINPRRELIGDLASIRWPAYDLFPMEVYRLLRYPNCTHTEFCLPVLSGRGCTFHCAFCYRMDTGFRPRTPDDVCDEVAFLQDRYRIGYIDFSDELLMSSKPRTLEFCQRILDRKMRFRWSCNGRLNYATPEVLKAMKAAGCVFINYGIESVDDTVLKNMNKALTYKMIVRGIEATLAAGISPGLNVIFGNRGDNAETLRKSVDFIKKYSDFSQLRTIRPVTPYPGSPLYYDAIRDGQLKDCADFYENKHTNSDLLSVNFTELGDDEVHELLRMANRELIGHYFESQRDSWLRQTDDLYGGRDPNFRGYRQT